MPPFPLPSPRRSHSPAPAPALTRRRTALALAATATAAALSAPPATARGRRPRLVAADRVGERILDLTLDSPALGREGHARVLLPRGWDRAHGRRWPVLYLLHGCCDQLPGWQAWTANTDADALTADIPALVVCPEGGPYGFYSDWWNAGQGGPPAWETFHLVELRGILERELRANDRRAIAGLSMGGHGALTYTARHPRMFRAAASFSGVIHTRRNPEIIQGIVSGHGADPLGLWGDPVAQVGVWSAHDPHDLLTRIPRGLPLYVASGDGTPGPLDEPGRDPDPLEAGLLLQSQDYVTRARTHGLRVHADFYGAGTHTWPYWQRGLERALPMLAHSIGAGGRTTAGD